MMTEQTIYELIAIGESRNGYGGRIHSRLMFESCAEAEAHILEFRAKCCDPAPFESLVDNDNLNIFIGSRVLRRS